MNRRLTRIALVTALAITGTMGIASTARADHHLIMVREVHRGAAAADNYIMLQMFADGQNVNLPSHYIDILDSTGMAGAEYPLPAVPIGLNQRTILIGNAVPGADFNNAGVVIPQNGAVCYDETNGYNGTNGLDCVAWGAFTGTTHPLSSPGLPVALPGTGLAPGQSLVRTISRGCATQLDAPDDTNNSAADFSLGSPIGRPNAASPTETACGPAPANPYGQKCKKSGQSGVGNGGQYFGKKHKHKHKKCKKKKKKKK
jgi:hypothetical protein